MTMELAGELATAILLVRVFGRDAARLLGRAAAVGVRAGVTELRRGTDVRGADGGHR